MTIVLALLLAILLPPPAEPGPVHAVRPVPGAVLTGYAPPSVRWGAGHRGVDLAVVEGDEVHAAMAGSVAYVGVIDGVPIVSISHGELRTTYEPVRAAVKVGDLVQRGSAIGVISGPHEGCPQAACLHWGAKRGEDYLNPLSLLGTSLIRLIPNSGPGVSLPERGPQPFIGDVGVDLRRGQRGVPQHFLDAAQIRATFENMRSHRVAQPVRAEIRGTLDDSQRLVHDAPHHTLVDPSAPIPHKHRLSSSGFG